MCPGVRTKLREVSLQVPHVAWHGGAHTTDCQWGARVFQQLPRAQRALKMFPVGERPASDFPAATSAYFRRAQRASGRAAPGMPRATSEQTYPERSEGKIFSGRTGIGAPLAGYSAFFS